MRIFGNGFVTRKMRRMVWKYEQSLTRWLNSGFGSEKKQIIRHGLLWQALGSGTCRFLFGVNLLQPFSNRASFQLIQLIQSRMPLTTTASFCDGRKGKWKIYSRKSSHGFKR